MSRVQGSAFILRKWELGESDLLVSFLDQERGKRRGVAKGAKRSKKRFGGLLSPFLLLQLDYAEKPGGSLARIEACSLVRYYASLHMDLSKLLVGCSWLELLERVLPEGEEARVFFPLLEEALGLLDNREKAGSLLWVFLVKCLTVMGLAPQFRTCIRCKRKLGSAGIFGFSVAQGGAVCGDCSRKSPVSHRVDAKTLALLDQWIVAPMRSIGEANGAGANLREAEGVVEAFLCYHVVHELRSVRVLRRVERAMLVKGDFREHPGSDLLS